MAEPACKKPRAVAKIYVLLDSEAWFGPLRQELDHERLPYEVWNLVERSVDLCGKPPEGVFLNRISASCHTRGHREAAEYGRQLVLWLLAHGRRVLNGGAPAGAAIDFELSKAKQMQSLTLAGLSVPASQAVPVPLLTWSATAAAGEPTFAFPADPGTCSAPEALKGSLRRLADTIDTMNGPVVVKPNCGGRGVGVVKLMESQAAVRALREVDGGGPVPDWIQEAWPVDGVLIVQRLIEPEEPAFITRIEIVGGRFGYAQKTDISDGATHLCTADGCTSKPRFSWRAEITAESPISKACVDFAVQHGLDIVGIEYIEAAGTGAEFVYDINPNTNYSAVVQKEAGKNLYAEVAALCSAELQAAAMP